MSTPSREPDKHGSEKRETACLPLGDCGSAIAPNWRLGEFTGRGYEKGRSIFHQIAWFICLNLLFVKWWFPARLRPPLLRLFGARVGRRVLIRHRVRVHWPWKLRIGDDVWIGEGAWLLNLEDIDIKSNSCVSQGALLCTGSHDRRSPTFEFDNGPIVIGPSAWIGANAVVLRGVAVHEGAVIGAAATARRDVHCGEVLQ